MTRLTRRLHNAGIADESAFLVTDPVKGAGPRSRLILHETRVLSLECAILYTVMADVQERRVFISSTFRDLLEERRKVLEAVLELKAFPSGTEMFPSADDEQWEFIKREIDSSDYYVLVVAGKYGCARSRRRQLHREGVRVCPRGRHTRAHVLVP